MPIVTIEWYEGRSPDRKREIAERLTQLLTEVADVPAEQVTIRFVDTKPGDWAIGGEVQGRPSEPALGPPD